MPLALYALALAAFSIGTAEFVIAGILPALSADLSVSIPSAGLLVTGYAVGVAVGGPILAVLTANRARKPVIVLMIGLFALGQVICALAPSYEWLMGARVVIGCAHGVFYGVASVAVANLVPVGRRGSALALFFSGVTVANILGVPGGTAIGNAFGWRMTFWAVAAMAVIATACIALLLPPGPPRRVKEAGLGVQLATLANQQVLLGYLLIAVVMIGAIAYSTFQIPLLIEITGVAPEHAPLFLLIAGIGSVMGILAGGRLTDWRPMPSLIVILLLHALVTAAVLLTMRDPVLMAVNMFISSAIGFAFATPVQARILHAAQSAPNLASTLVSTAFNIGIALGALLGAYLLESGASYADLPLVGTFTSLAAAAIAALSWWLDKRAPLPAASPARP